MTILSEVYDMLLNCLPSPPECGGIIGISNGVVCKCYFDTAVCQCSRAIYVPNVELLNIKIQQWNQEGIEFAGIFHSHPLDQPRLSGDDIIYIRTILNAMPGSITQLFFPIVLPKIGLIPFKAVRHGNSIQVFEEKLTLI